MSCQKEWSREEHWGGGGFDRGGRALPGSWRSDFEAPAAIRVSRVGRAPIKPKEECFSLEQVPPTHTLLARGTLGRRRPAALDVAHALLVHIALGRREHDVVRVADRLEDVHASDARLPRNVHGPVW